MDELIKELKAEGVLKSPLVEAAFRAIDRRDFVPEEFRGAAYANHPLPIGEGQTISQPYTVAFMLDLLDPRPGEKILDIGAGSGWQSALLAHVVSQEGGNQKSKIKNQNIGKVFAIERIQNLCDLARSNIEKYGFIKNGAVRLVCADATQDLRKYGPFDKIIAAAAAGRDIPQAWREQLEVGGKIAAPVDDAIRLYEKISKTEWREKTFPGFAFVPLVHPVTPRFKGTGFTGRVSAGHVSNFISNGAGSNGVESKVKKEGKPAEKPKKSSGRRKWAKTLIAAYIALVLSFLGGAYAAFMPLRIPARVEIEIPQSAGSRVIGGILKTKGLIRSKWSFVIYATIAGKASKLKPGKYEFGGETAVPDLVRQIVRGERYPNERIVVIPEGWDVRDIGEYFEKSGIAAAEEWWGIVGTPAEGYRSTGRPTKDFSKDFGFLSGKLPGIGLEGFLFPDTYRIFRDAAAEDIAGKMLENFDRKLTTDLRAEIARQKKTIFAMITMASLLEKEIPDPAEREITAGILWKRLARDMPLQVDAAINYITGKKDSPSSADLALNSPYNTYRHRGLPPGPISNPGLGAIRAAVFPKKSEYLFYLSARDGKTIFSRTLAEHNAAKAKYLGR